MPGSVEALQILILLMPGFITQGIVHTLTTRHPRSALVHVIAALAWSLWNYFMLGAIAWLFGMDVTWSQNAHDMRNVLLTSLDRRFVSLLGILIAVSLVSGVIGAITINRRWVYRAANALRITRKTGRQEVWLDVLEGYNTRWLSVELDDGTVLVGYARYFSYHPEPRELFLGDVEIVTSDGNRSEVEGILLSDWSRVKKLIVLPEEGKHEQRGENDGPETEEADTAVS